MPRRARLSIARIPWHIIQRGNNRSACFFNIGDYQYFLTTLQVLAKEFKCSVHAYVLMTNHVHLLLTPEYVDSVSWMMKNLCQKYTQFINRKYERTGTLWEGRFKSCLTQDELYILTCYRYIELNPVRAGIVYEPGEYAWSSYRFNGQGKINTLVTPHEQYLALGISDQEIQRMYRSLIKVQLDADTIKEIRKATNGNYVYGDDDFKNRMGKELNRRVTIGKPGRPRKTK